MSSKGDRTSTAFFEQVPLHFKCTGCGDCCTGGADYVVEVTREEQRRIQSHLGISWRWFRRRYVRRLDDGSESLEDADNACIFLDAGRRCRIYEVRPTQCRTYPFWPTLLTSERVWNAEARRCEGIGRGPVVPVTTIRARLARAK
jgi:Fe-S-cluster containining protein